MPQMTKLASVASGKSHESGVLCGSPSWFVKAKTLGLSPAAFSGFLVGRWIRSGAAMTQTNAHFGYWCHKQRDGLTPP